jgi:hypothetical protein
MTSWEGQLRPLRLLDSRCVLSVRSPSCPRTALPQTGHALMDFSRLQHVSLMLGQSVVFLVRLSPVRFDYLPGYDELP